LGRTIPKHTAAAEQLAGHWPVHRRRHRVNLLWPTGRNFGWQCDQALQKLAEGLLPQKDLLRTMPIYTQAIMDLGATVCKPKQPKCDACPVSKTCVAKRESLQERLPHKTRRIKRSQESMWLLLAFDSAGAICLCQRPQTGVWGGLFCPPWFTSETELLGALPADLRHRIERLPPIAHALTHKDLDLNPVKISLPTRITIAANCRWFAPIELTRVGLPGPLLKLLQTQEVLT
jgi:A/G-specific adenine glycosylase